MAVRRVRCSVNESPQLRPFIIENVRPTGRQLGVSSYGSVEELEVDGLMCAGKKLHDTLVEMGNAGVEEITQKFVEECQLMSGLRHPHIVQFLGICFLQSSNLPVLIMEFLLTSLNELLESKPDIPLYLKRSILRDVACGLVYLHNHSPPIIHRDLSSRNILLNSSMVAKITDLGVARILNLRPGQLAATMTQTPGTLAYMPPEVFEENPKCNAAIDMFAFGELSLFTVIQEFPLPTAPTYMDPDNPGMILGRSEVQRRARFIGELKERLGGEHRLVHLITQCLQNDPRRRPSAREALHRLDEMKPQIEDPYERVNKLEMIQTLGKMTAQIHQLEETAMHATEAQTQVKQLQEELSEVRSQLETKSSQVCSMQQRLEQLFPIFGGITATPQQQIQTQSQNLFTAFQQPQTATADQSPPKQASFNFHSTPAAAAGGVTQSSSSVPPFSFAPQLGFGQPGSGGNSGGNLTMAQGLGGSDAGGTKLQFGGSNLMGGAFSAGGNPNQAVSSKGGPVQNTRFNFSTGGGINLNFAAGTSTNSPNPVFSANASESNTISNHVIRKARRRKS